MPADSSVHPYFLPRELDFKQLPHGFKEAVDHLILPAYRDLVLRAQSGLERVAGMTLCHDMWLELLEQFELGRTIRETLPARPVVAMGLNAREPYRGPFLPGNLSLDRYLRLGARKEKVAKFLLQFQVAKARWGSSIGGAGASQPTARPARRAANESPSTDRPCRPLVNEAAEDASTESGSAPSRRPR